MSNHGTVIAILSFLLYGAASYPLTSKLVVRKYSLKSIGTYKKLFKLLLL